MTSFRCLVVVTCALLLNGCKSTYSEKNVTQEPPPLLGNRVRVYVAMPLDATFKKTVAQGSGKKTAQAVFVAFNRYTKSVSLGKFPESMAEALDSAREKNAEYLVYPNVVRWEDRATEFSGRRDQLEVKIDLIDLADSKLVFSREISASGKWMTDGGDTPNDLLEQPVEEYVNALFRRVEKPSALW
jgi:hypothetical protein